MPQILTLKACTKENKTTFLYLEIDSSFKWEKERGKKSTNTILDVILTSTVKQKDIILSITEYILKL